MIKHGWTAGLLTFFCLTQVTLAAPHPLDPLAEGEIIGAAEILLAGGGAKPSAVFQSVVLYPPDKDEVLAGGQVPREALVFFRQNERSFRTVVDLTSGEFTPPVEIPSDEGQLGLTIHEIFDFSYLISDPRFQDAMAARGRHGRIAGQRLRYAAYRRVVRAA